MYVCRYFLDANIPQRVGSLRPVVVVVVCVLLVSCVSQFFVTLTLSAHEQFYKPHAYSSVWFRY